MLSMKPHTSRLQSFSTPFLSDEDVEDYLEDLINHHIRIALRENLEEMWHRRLYERRFRKYLRKQSRNYFYLSNILEETENNNDLREGRSSHLLKARNLRYEFGPYAIEFVMNSHYVSSYFSLDHGLIFRKFSERELRGGFSDYNKIVSVMMFEIEEFLKNSICTKKPPIDSPLKHSNRNNAGYSAFI